MSLIVASPLGAAQSRTATVSPSWTVWPSATLISRTTPARGASTGISIFIDSSTMTGSPAARRSPALLVIWKTTPVMWALTSSGIEASLFDHLGVNPPATERRALEHAPVERDHGAYPFHDEAVQRGQHPGDRLLARVAPRDELGQERIVVY